MSYHGQSSGRLSTFLREYIEDHDSMIYDMGNTIWMGSINETNVVATYTWDASSDIPTFKFTDKYNHGNSEQLHKKEKIVKQQLVHDIANYLNEDEKLLVDIQDITVNPDSDRANVQQSDRQLDRCLKRFDENDAKFGKLRNAWDKYGIVVHRADNLNVDITTGNGRSPVRIDFTDVLQGLVKNGKQ